MRVRDIMLPKNQMICINQDVNFKEIIKIVTQSGHSRFPVTGENKMKLLEFYMPKICYAIKQARDTDFDLDDIFRLATFVPESKRLDILLSEFRSNRNHMAIVVDEYGEVNGFVTIEDIIEQIIGDIEDEFDIDEDAYIKAHSDDHYIVKAHTPIEEFNEQLNANFSDETYDTIGGIVMNNFGYLPKRGEVLQLTILNLKLLMQMQDELNIRML